MRPLRSAWAWVSGVAVFALMALCMVFLPVFARPRAWDSIAKALSRLLASCFGMKVRVRGLENLDSTDGMVLVCNHVNLVDPFLLYGHVPLFFRGLEQADHFSWPVWGWLSRRFDNIPLDRSGGGSTAGALRAAGAALAAGTSILVFPEGHRTRDGGFGAFHRGAFRLAARQGATLVPIVQAGSWEVFRKGSLGIRPGPVELTVLPPWPRERYAGLDESAFLKLVREEMLGAWAESREGIARSRSG
ncbi:MAG: lysophospholipid acyltransferase family protein [Spirochaetes bacterium]|nr:lysophospholipid acyltransferase family protein [Spirochaetota bacterium]